MHWDKAFILVLCVSILHKGLTGESVKGNWKQQRNPALPSNSHLVFDRTNKEEGSMLPRKDWVSLDRFRTDLRKRRSNLAKWGMINYAICECEVPIQTIQWLSSNKICKVTGRRPPSEVNFMRLDYNFQIYLYILHTFVYFYLNILTCTIFCKTIRNTIIL